MNWGKRCQLLLLVFALLLTGYSLQASAAEERTIPVSFFGVGLTKPATFDVPFDDSCFDVDARQYQHRLAQSSIGLAVASFRDDTGTFEQRDNPIVSFLNSAGFQQIQTEEYDVPTGENTIGTALAYLPKDGYTLVAIAISGAGYQNEWLGNFDVGSGNEHQGFASAAASVVDRLDAYLAAQGLTGRIKVWTAGFSRAAAVANLTAARIVDAGQIAPEDVFAYCFATPNNTMNTQKEYSQIFNIVGQFDPVPTVPFAEWQYGKAGVVLTLPAQETDADYADKKAAMNAVFEPLTGHTYQNDPAANWLINKMCDVIYQVCPTPADYAGDYQTMLKKVWNEKGGGVQSLAACMETILRDQAIQGLFRQEGDTLVNLISQELYDQFLTLLGIRHNTWDNLEDVLSHVIQEHYPQVYISWLYSTDDPAQLFTTQKQYRRVLLSGDLSLSVIDGSGEAWTSEALLSVADTKNAPVVAMMIGNEVMLVFPADQNYMLIGTAESNTTLRLETRAHYAGALSASTLQYTQREIPKDTIVTLNVNPNLIDGELFIGDDSVKLSNATGAASESGIFDPQADLEFSSPIARNFLWVLLGGCVFIVILLVCAIALIVHGHRKRKKRRTQAKVADTAQKLK